MVFGERPHQAGAQSIALRGERFIHRVGPAVPVGRKTLTRQAFLSVLKRFYAFRPPSPVRRLALPRLVLRPHSALLPFQLRPAAQVKAKSKEVKGRRRVDVLI